MGLKVFKNQILLFVLLLAFWLIIVPSIDLVQIVVGSIVALAITAYSFDIAKATKPFNFNLFYVFKFIRFGLILLVEIVKSNIEVAKIILAPKLKIRPKFIRVDNPLKSDLNRVIYGNAITLTPGTITVELEEDYIIIHALNSSVPTDKSGGILGRAVKKLEDKNHG
jgi:multicomponent Na+:H+ antiporter subunit E